MDKKPESAKNGKNGSIGYVLSDLHLTRAKFTKQRFPDPLQRAAARAACFVLNGDIFDFQRIAPADFEKATLDAARWLASLAEAFPSCRFIYIMGNHDGLEPLACRVEGFAAGLDNLELHPAFFRMEDRLFLHGDLALRPQGGSIFHRDLRSRPKKKSRLLNACYRLLIRTGGHGSVELVYGKRRCAEKILKALEAERAPWVKEIREIYFGHTHTPFTCYLHRGKAFHNTGSLIQGLETNLLAYPLKTFPEPCPAGRS